jgi:error-prone DNA polymerase
MNAFAPDGSPAYAELAATSCFDFLRGASRPEEMAQTACAFGYSALAVTDRNTLAGVVRLHTQVKDTNEAFGAKLQTIIGARLAFQDGAPEMLVYPRHREGYAGLCRLLSRGGMGAGVKKGECRLTFEDMLNEAQGLLFAFAPTKRPGEPLRPFIDRLAERAPGRVWLAGAMGYGPSDARRLDILADLARTSGVRLLATGDVLYHHPARRELHDVMTCIREHTTIDVAGVKLQPNAERHLKPRAEIGRLYRDHPDAVAETLRLADLCRFSLDELKYEYPHEPTPPGKTSQQHLKSLTWQGAHRRYPKGVPPKVKRTLAEEFRIIALEKYAPYFLTVHDVVAFARSKDILCQGRGSAANSAVCFCLGITAVDPAEHDLLFARFVSSDRKEPPDIDVDFEHERREEVIQHIYERYGRHRAAICATVIHYRPRSAIREVGKALGLSEDVTGALAGMVWGSWGGQVETEHIRQVGLDPDNPVLRRAIRLASELIGFPRHLSQHVGGFVLTERRLDETVPIVNGAMKYRTFIEWDKDDIDALGILKVDVLALGMLTCIRKAFTLMQAEGMPVMDLADLPKDQPDVYRMLSAGDSIGVFQVESRAQINMLPRLKPEKFYDLVIEVAIVRPGPIQGDMVHPYLKRKQGLEKVVFPAPSPKHGPADELMNVLGKTLGVPLFQEQAMQLAITAAGFAPDKADRLRRAMATFKNVGLIEQFGADMVGGMTARGYDHDFATRCFKQIEGFGSYGFPESHAASFAKLVYVSAFIKCRHPAIFAAALLNSQPMGFYAPAQIVRDAVEHGVEVRPIDVDHSQWDCSIESGNADGPALRLGFRQIEGFSEGWAKKLIDARGYGFGDFDTLVLRSGLTRSQLQKLADADALRSLGLGRREGLWQVRSVASAAPAPLADRAKGKEIAPLLPLMDLSQHVIADYRATRLSLKAHPMAFLRETFTQESAIRCSDLLTMKDRALASVAGVVLVRQRPGTGTVCFITLEDETGVANLVVLPPVFTRYRREIMSARLLLAKGRIQRTPEGIVHLLTDALIDRTEALAPLSDEVEDRFKPPLARADHGVRGVPARRSNQRHPRDVRVILPSRDFH